jgi:hypothetical protein
LILLPHVGRFHQIFISNCCRPLPDQIHLWLIKQCASMCSTELQKLFGK